MNELKELAKKYWIGIVLFIITMGIMNSVFGTVCYSVILFGIPCPTCGITRAALLMLTGHFHESLQMHPLLLLVIFEIFFCLIIKRKLKNHRFFISINIIITVIIFVCFYIYRMKTDFPYVEPMVFRRDNYLHNIITILNKCKLQK